LLSVSQWPLFVPRLLVQRAAGAHALAVTAPLLCAVFQTAASAVLPTLKSTTPRRGKAARAVLHTLAGMPLPVLLAVMRGEAPAADTAVDGPVSDADMAALALCAVERFIPDDTNAAATVFDYLGTPPCRSGHWVFRCRMV
jgi:hypothetical protein